MRISGLSSGIDTESIINDMMKAHRLPLNKITQKKQYLEWQLDDYRSINRDLRKRSDDLFDNMLRSSQAFNQKTVNISNPEAVSIKGVNAATDFAGSIQVTQLASQASLIGKKEEFKKDTVIKEDQRISIQAPGEDAAKEVVIKAGTTIQKALEQINKETGVSAFLDEHSGKVALTAKQSGKGNIVVTGGDFLGLSGNGTTQIEGKNAEFTFNGLATERATNTFSINGFEISLKKTTTEAVSFTSSPNVDAVVETIEKFVNDYNELIDGLNRKIREPKYRSFHPLSSEEKEAMKDREIELWEEKAKSGTLRNDPTISNMLSSMRTAVVSSIELGNGEKISLRDIGITTSLAYSENGKLEINKDKLKEAILADPGKVRELFAQSTTAAEGNGKGGLAVQVRKAMDDARSTISQRAGNAGAGVDSFTLGRTLKTMNQQIERFEERLQRTEDRYWKQFTAMEKAIQRANEQSAQLMNSLGGM